MLALLLACANTAETTFPTCTVDLIGLEPASAQVGDTVTLTATPLTQLQDSALRVGGVDAVVSSLDRTDCETCDSCRSTNGCAECGQDCDACDAECRDSCVETLTFLVPELAPGSHGVVLYTAHGGSLQTSLEVLEAAGDTGGPDSGLQDSGP